jgi:hypothetical protein
MDGEHSYMSSKKLRVMNIVNQKTVPIRVTNIVNQKTVPIRVTNIVNQKTVPIVYLLSIFATVLLLLQADIKFDNVSTSSILGLDIAGHARLYAVKGRLGFGWERALGKLRSGQQDVKYVSKEECTWAVSGL